MFPVPQMAIRRDQHTPISAIVKLKGEEIVVQLHVEKKVNVPQDLMVEELSLPITKGSRLYQKRQKRVEKFVLEHPTRYLLMSNGTAGEEGCSNHGDVGTAEGQMCDHNAEEKENYPDGTHSATSGNGPPPKISKKTNKLLQGSKALNPNDIAPDPEMAIRKEQHTSVSATEKQNGEEFALQLDLGKKVSVPQDLMVEELSLPITKGSRLYQQRQKRMEKFVLKHPTGFQLMSRRTAGEEGRLSNGDVGTAEGQMYAHNAEKENYPDGTHLAASGEGVPPKISKKTNKVLQMSKALNPSDIAPGYNGPLKEVPPEKFNWTVIPKAYQSPWQEFLSNYQADSAIRFAEPPRKVNSFAARSFNRTPTPFGGPLLDGGFPGFVIGEDYTNAMSSLELMLNRRSFNRTPQGWKYVMPESEDL